MARRKKAACPRARRCLDLFGEVPVTWPEVWAWVEVVGGLQRDSWRARYYIQHWNVPEKIRAAKRAGTFEALIQVARGPSWTAEGSSLPSTAWALRSATTASASAASAIQ